MERSAISFGAVSSRNGAILAGAAWSSTLRPVVAAVFAATPLASRARRWRDARACSLALRVRHAGSRLPVACGRHRRRPLMAGRHHPRMGPAAWPAPRCRRRLFDIARAVRLAAAAVACLRSPGPDPSLPARRRRSPGACSAAPGVRPRGLCTATAHRRGTPRPRALAAIVPRELPCRHRLLAARPSALT